MICKKCGKESETKICKECKLKIELKNHKEKHYFFKDIPLTTT